MNFFGHAVVAQRVSDDPAFVLGAMLPDFAALSGCAPRVSSAAIAAGVAHHHRADALFHDGAAFRGLWREAVAALDAGGLPRGGARGAAHVGIELLLDGVLARDDRAGGVAAFRRTLEAATADRLGRALEFADQAAAARWWRLRERLLDGSVPGRYGEPDFVCLRVAGALGRRPRLALDAAAVQVLRGYLPALQRRVVAAAGALVAATGPG